RWSLDESLQAQKAAGRKIVGHPDINCPEELIIAAGCEPMLITGDANCPPKLVDGHVDGASSLSTRYLYEGLLSGRYGFLDLICRTGGDRWLASTQGFLAAERRLDPKLKIAECYFLERLRSTFKQHRDFNLSRLLAFRTFLEDWTGRKITD